MADRAPRRVLCLFLPHLSADRVRGAAPTRLPPEAQVSPAAACGSPLSESRGGAPVALTRRRGAAQIVVQCCPLAESLGVQAGITLAQALALVPHLAVQEAQPLVDARHLEQLADWARHFSPLVAAAAPDALLLEIGGCLRVMGGERNLAQQALGGLLRQGYEARAACADTVGAAYALASSGSQSLAFCPAGCAAAQLAPLPPAALRIDAITVERLHALGVRTIGDLLMLPRSSLPARFGALLVLRVQQALGEVFEGIDARAPQTPVQAQWVFEPPVCVPAPLQAVAERLLADVLAQLAQRGLALRRLELLAALERDPPQRLEVVLSRSTRGGAHVSQLLRQRVETLDARRGVRGMLLAACDAPPWVGRQHTLLQVTSAETDEQFGQLLDRLVARLGPDAVVRARLLEDHQPEAAFCYEPYTLQDGGQDE